MVELSLLDAALLYASKGWHVFPCRGKLPLTRHGFKEASCHPYQIKRWWQRWPDANIAIATGEKSGLIVIDIDGDEGFSNLKKLEREHGPFPITLTVKTGKGRHFYFNYPPGCGIGNSAGKLGKGIDVRGEGGYVMAPPSIHPDTGMVYEFVK